MHDVTILYDVLLALDAELTSLAYCSLRAILDIVIILDDLCTDESLLEVGMDDAGTLRSRV